MEITHFVRQQLERVFFFFLNVRRLRATLSLTVYVDRHCNSFYYYRTYLESHFGKFAILIKVKTR